MKFIYKLLPSRIGKDRSALTLIVLFAILIRILLIFAFKSHDISSQNNHWAFGYETGRVARSIASGDGFSSPFEEGSTPTAWVAPVYPIILALIFKVFGIYSANSALAILFTNTLFSSLTCIVIYDISKHTFNKRTATISSILFAIYPPSIWHSINTIWGTTLSALLLSTLILYAIKSVKTPGVRQFLIIGTLMGITALTSPVVIAFYPFYLFWIASKLKTDPKNLRRYLLGIISSFILVMMPWMLRNYIVFNKFVLVKSTLGVELRLGNNPNATGTFEMKKGKALHPTFSKKELERFKQLKEIKYSQQSLREALNFILDNPQKVFVLSVKRFYLFWFGDLFSKNSWTGNLQSIINFSLLKKIFNFLPIPFFLLGTVIAIKRRREISLLLSLLMSYPLIYYFVHVTNRYRHAIEPIILILASYALILIYDKFSGKKDSQIIE